RTAQPVGVVAIVKRVVALPVRGERGVGGRGRQRDRRAVPPAPHDLGGEQLFAARIQGGGLREPLPERHNVLAKLAVDHVRAVDAQLHGRRRRGQHSLFVGV